MSAAGPGPVARRRLERTMGGGGELVVVGGDDPSWLLDVATSRLADLEERWSRFVATSDVSRVQSAPGRWIDVAPETIDVLALAVDGWLATCGRFDPTVGHAVAGLGYDRTFDEVRDRPAAPITAGPAPGPRAIEIDEPNARVRVPAGIGLDLGGIGKGRAADLVADELVSLGATGACVNLGGDLAVRGEGPDLGRWTVAVTDPWHPDVAAADLGRLALASGGVATSTTLLRRWTDHDGRHLHHLVDPASGRPSRSPLVAVTVVASEAAWAEVLAKAALLAGPREGTALLRSHGVAGLLVSADGATTVAGDLDAYGGPFSSPVPEALT